MNNMFERYAKIENTRMIFDFMCELDQRCVETRNLQYNGNGGLKQRFEIVQVLSNEIDNLIENSKSKSKELFLYQNPLTQYIIFWNEMYKQNAINFTDDKKTYLKIISNMLNYFRCIKCLDDMNKINIKNDDLPYIYEDICLSICNITNSHMCYILCQDANNSIQTVMTSSCIIDSDTKSVLDINADKLIENACTPKNEKIGGIYYYCVKDNKSGISNGTYIVISLPEHYYQDATDRKFYIVLQKKKVVEYNDDFMKTLSMILFLKDRFISVLKRDFAVLLNLRFDVSYIKSINIDFEQAITILHLSDLHVTENKKWDITSKTVKEIIKKVETSSSTQKIDLIAITGDIVQASNNANSAQEKYMKVEKIIQEVAVKLWGENKEIENELFFHTPPRLEAKNFDNNRES